LQRTIVAKQVHEKWKRENRNHGNQEKGKEEKEALREVPSSKPGTRKRPLSFF
jgi:hypothetical protein